jgi:hypothetical protein
MFFNQFFNITDLQYVLGVNIKTIHRYIHTLEMPKGQPSAKVGPRFPRSNSRGYSIAALVEWLERRYTEGGKAPSDLARLTRCRGLGARVAQSEAFKAEALDCNGQEKSNQAYPEYLYEYDNWLKQYIAQEAEEAERSASFAFLGGRA